jgi:hypothetical protein
MEMLSLFEDPKYLEKEAIAGKLSMSVRQVYRAWDKVLEGREKSQRYVTELDKVKSYCHFLYNFFTAKWYPDPSKTFTQKEERLLAKIEKELEEMSKD